MESRDILKASEPGNFHNLNENLNSLVSQGFKNVPFYQEDLTKPSLTEHLAKKLNLPLEVSCIATTVPLKSSLALDSFASTVTESHPHTVSTGTWLVPRCCSSTWRTTEALMNTGNIGFLSFRPQGRSRTIT